MVEVVLPPAPDKLWAVVGAEPIIQAAPEGMGPLAAEEEEVLLAELEELAAAMAHRMAAAAARASEAGSSS